MGFYTDTLTASQRAGQRATEDINRAGDLLTQYQQDREAIKQKDIDNTRQADRLKLALEAGARQASEFDRIGAEREATRKGLLGLIPKGMVIPEGSDVGKLLTTQNTLINQRAKTPGTPEHDAAQKGELDLYKKKLGIAAQYKTPKDTATTKQKNYQFLVDSGVSQDKAFKSIFGDSESSASSAKTSTNLSKLIGSVGNPTKVQESLSRAKKLGIGEKEFYNKLLQAGGADLESKGFTDFGKKDLDLDTINAALSRMEGDTSTAESDTEQPIITTEDGEFKLPKTGASTVRANIVNDIKDLRNPSFLGVSTGKGVIDSSVKQQIDAKYGKGAYDRFQSLAR